MIAGLLPTSSKSTLSGSVTVNGVASTDPSIVWTNIVAYVDQIDRLHGYLTVKETMEFAYDCRLAGTHDGPRIKDINNADVKKLIAELDDEGWMVETVLQAIGLKRVEDTFVGDNRVRGVSGGQRKRVTVGEMMCVASQVQMYDEISTGLDGNASCMVVIVTLLLFGFSLDHIYCALSSFSSFYHSIHYIRHCQTHWRNKSHEKIH